VREDAPVKPEVRSPAAIPAKQSFSFSSSFSFSTDRFRQISDLTHQTEPSNESQRQENENDGPG
jgi:hypothetical protein